jgi:hypothetical protein
VPGVGEQGQGAGDDADDELDGDERDGEQERPEQRAPALTASNAFNP